MKSYKFLCGSIMLTAMCAGFTACHEGDLDVPEGAPASVVDGLRIRSVSDYKYSYDELGRVTSLAGLEVSYDNGYMEIEDFGKAYINKDGYICKLEDSYSEDGEKWKETVNISYSNGRLTKIDGSYEYKDDEGKGSGKFNAKFNYSKENLTKIEWSYKDEESEGNDKSKEEGEGKVTISYSSSSPVNRYQFMLPGECYDTGLMDEGMFFSGLFGKGSKELPTSAKFECKEVEYENGKKYDEDEYTATQNFSYQLNDEGLVTSYTVDGNETGDGAYSYTRNIRYCRPTEDATRAAAWKQPTRQHKTMIQHMREMVRRQK